VAKLTGKCEFERGHSFTGYAAIFNERDYDGDVFLPGAFRETLKSSGGIVPIFWQEQMIGWVDSAHEDSIGLLVSGRLTENGIARCVYESIELGLRVNGNLGLQVGFAVPRGGSYRRMGARHLQRVELLEVSIVHRPANPRTIISSCT